MSAAPQPTLSASRRPILVAALGLLAALALAYHNSFRLPFVFDDIPAIVDNASIRQLWPPRAVLAPALEDAGVTVSGRPLVNLSLAINHALGGQDVTGYHAVNWLIHLLAALTLFGVVRRTVTLSPVRSLRENALGLGFFAALLWALHPLQTESVAYVVQRAESMAGLCYLLALHGFIRAMASAPPASGRWLGVSVTACLAGMACKEVMVSAPLLIFLYDRTFVAGSFREAWRRRRLYYIGLAGAWLLLAWLVAGTAGRGGTAGFGAGISVWSYGLTQCQAVVRYLRLAVWPHPLVFDYGTAVVAGFGEVWPRALALVGLAGGTVVALVRRPRWGFVGAWFFALLAPSSSFVPIASQTMAEHRMYLPLASVVVLAVAGLYAWLGRRAGPVCALVALVCVALTVRRNEDYRSEAALWADTVAKVPANARAHNNLGKAVFALGRFEAAAGHYQTAIRLEPGKAEQHYNLGLALARLNRRAGAIAEYETALRLQPAYAEAHNNLGSVLLQEGRTQEAIIQFARAVQLRPGFPDAQGNLANALLDAGRLPEALVAAREGVRLDPAHAEARYNLGNVLAQAGDLPAALTEYEAALRLRPDDADVANNLGNVLVQLDRLTEAMARYEQALRLRPDYADPRRNLAQVLAHLGRLGEARAHFEFLLRQDPDDLVARAGLARLRAPGGP